jgi:hypothetical protein
VPKRLSWVPVSGMPIELAVPAKMVAVPVSEPVQLAIPLLSTLTGEAMFPLHNPLLEPTHQIRFANGTGLDEPRYVPVAVNCTWRLGKFRASAVAGVMVTDVSSLPPPHPVRGSATRATRLSAILLVIEQPPSRVRRRWGAGVGPGCSGLRDPTHHPPQSWLDDTMAVAGQVPAPS